MTSPRLLAAVAALLMMSAANCCRGADEAGGTKPTGAVRFLRGPTVTIDDNASPNQVKIAFELSAATDVVVGIVNADGVVVRHLAGGLLGPKAPAPLQAASLAQTLVWDRTDDRGKPAPPGKYAVRVSAGLLPKFERLIGYEPLALSTILGLAVGPEGELFVLNSGGRWVEAWKPTPDVTVFSRDLKYRRTILPWPGDLAAKDVQGVAPLIRPDGQCIPRIYHGAGRIGYPGFYGRMPAANMLITPGGDLLMVCALAGPWAPPGAPRLLRVRASDGAIPGAFEANSFFGKSMAANGRHRGGPSGKPQMALSADGQWIYLAGLGWGGTNVTGVGGLGAGISLHAVYRCPAGSNDPATVFVGTPDEPGNDEKSLCRPAGVAVDGDGNVLVADQGNDRIAVFSPEGRPLGAFKVAMPDCLAVDRKRGSVYVFSCEQGGKGPGAGPVRTRTIVRFKSWKEPQVTGEWAVKMPQPPTLMAIDDGAERPILWLCDSSGKSGGLWRLVDEHPAGPLPEPKLVAGGSAFPDGLLSCEHLAVDPATEKVYVSEFNWYGDPRWHAYDGRTGRPVAIGKIDGAELCAGYDGRLYAYKGVYGKGSWITRWDRDGKPVPFDGTDSNISERLQDDAFRSSGDKEGVRGLDVDREGNVIAGYFQMSAWDPKAHAWVCAVGPDGKVKRRDVLGEMSRSASSLRVDPQGNIYVMDDVLPPDVPTAPPGFVELQQDKRSPYRGLFGSIVKFPPAGGAIRPAGPAAPTAEGVEQVKSYNGFAVEGATWIRPYAAPVYGRELANLSARFGTDKKSSDNGLLVVPLTSSYGCCFCFSGRFGMDRYGRLFVPIAPARQVEVADSEGNSIGFFGRYGNVDNSGPGSLRPVEGVPLNWCGNVAVSDTAAYIADTNNRCVIKVKLNYRAEASCPVQ